MKQKIQGIHQLIQAWLSSNGSQSSTFLIRLFQKSHSCAPALPHKSHHNQGSSDISANPGFLKAEDPAARRRYTVLAGLPFPAPAFRHYHHQILFLRPALDIGAIHPIHAADKHAVQKIQRLIPLLFSLRCERRTIHGTGNPNRTGRRKR